MKRIKETKSQTFNHFLELYIERLLESKKRIVFLPAGKSFDDFVRWAFGETIT